MGGTDGQSSRIEDRNCVARLGVFRAVDIRSINPDVTRRKPIGGAALNTERRALHVLLF